MSYCRKVMVMSSSKARPTQFSSGARTWGELQGDLRREFPNLSDMRVTVKQTRNDLSDSAAVLPEGDFSIYLTQRKMKAGAKINIVSLLDALREKWNDAINELIDEVEEGEHDKDESEDDNDCNDEVDLAMTSEDREVLEQLQGKNRR